MWTSDDDSSDVYGADVEDPQLEEEESVFLFSQKAPRQMELLSPLPSEAYLQVLANEVGDGIAVLSYGVYPKRVLDAGFLKAVY
jgi:hypothetical protein